MKYIKHLRFTTRVSLTRVSGRGCLSRHIPITVCVCVSRARCVSAELHPSTARDPHISSIRADREKKTWKPPALEISRGVSHCIFIYALVNTSNFRVHITQHMRFAICVLLSRCTPEGPHTHARTPPKASRSSQRHGHVSSQCSIEDGDNGLDRIGADSLVEAGVVKFHGEVSCRGVVQRGSLTGLRVADAISMRTSHPRSLF